MVIKSFSGPYAFLSNFYLFKFEVEGESYRTLEHAYQAYKTGDPVWRQQIREAPTPARAKRLGRKCPIRADWEQIKLNVMRTLLRLKFADPVLRDRLSATAPAQLVKGNQWGDRFWGECPIGTGENWLGKLLMELREGKEKERIQMTKSFCDRCGVDTTGAPDMEVLSLFSATQGMRVGLIAAVCGASQKNCRQALIDLFAEQCGAKVSVTVSVSGAAPGVVTG